MVGELPLTWCRLSFSSAALCKTENILVANSKIQWTIKIHNPYVKHEVNLKSHVTPLQVTYKSIVENPKNYCQYWKTILYLWIRSCFSNCTYTPKNVIKLHNSKHWFLPLGQSNAVPRVPFHCNECACNL